MSAAYMEIRVRDTAPDPAFSLQTLFAHLGDASLSRATYAARLRLETVPFDDPCFLHLTRGGYRVTGAGEDFAAPVGGSFLLMPHTRLDILADHFQVTTVTLPRALVAEVAGAGSSRHGAEVGFTSMLPTSKSLEQQWIGTLSHVRRSILAHPEVASNALIVGQARRLLAATALLAFPNTMVRADQTMPGGAAAGTVRRATAFIEENADRDITVAEIAGAARVGVGALREAFRVHLGTTPVAQLRRTRLDLAHRELVEAARSGSWAPGTASGGVSGGASGGASGWASGGADAPGAAETLAVIARRWGFLDARRFAAEYRRAYGRSPSETLRP